METLENRFVTPIIDEEKMKITLNPASAKMKAKLYENPNIDLPLTRFFEFEIDVIPFEYENVVQKTKVILEFIDFKIEDWQQLFDHEFAFPKNPEDGYIDGSMFLADVHNPADVTKISIGPRKENSVEINMDIEFDFTYEGPEELGIQSCHWSFRTELDINSFEQVFEEYKIQCRSNTHNNSKG